MDRDGSVRGVVLAGGSSARFGEADKALATLDGRPLLAHVVESVSAPTVHNPLLAVTTREEGDRLAAATDSAVTAVPDDPNYAGPLAGIGSAARRVEVPWIFVCGCDMPLVSRDAVTAVIQRVTADVDAVVPVIDGRDQPLFAVYSRDAVLTAVSSLTRSAGLSALLDRLGTVDRITATDVDAPLSAAVTNVNTQSDLEAVRDRSTD